MSKHRFDRPLLDEPESMLPRASCGSNVPYASVPTRPSEYYRYVLEERGVRAPLVVSLLLGVAVAALIVGIII